MNLSEYVEELLRLDASLRRRVLVVWRFVLPGIPRSYVDGYADELLTVIGKCVTHDPRLAMEIVS